MKVSEEVDGSITARFVDVHTCLLARSHGKVTTTVENSEYSTVFVARIHPLSKVTLLNLFRGRCSPHLFDR